MANKVIKGALTQARGLRIPAPDAYSGPPTLCVVHSVKMVFLGSFLLVAGMHPHLGS